MEEKKEKEIACLTCKAYYDKELPCFLRGTTCEGKMKICFHYIGDEKESE